MAKNDFDIDFDFEEEYGFDPKAILDSEYTDEDLDLSQFDDDLGIDLKEAGAEFADFLRIRIIVDTINKWLSCFLLIIYIFLLASYLSSHDTISKKHKLLYQLVCIL